MADDRSLDCPDCRDPEGISRRDFVRTLGIGGAALAGGLLPAFGTPRRAAAFAGKGPTATCAAETRCRFGTG